MRIAVIAAILLVTGGADAQDVRAQGKRAQDERARWASMSDQNQLGLLEYCQAQGHVPAEIVARQRAALPTSDTGSANAAGRTGMIQYADPQVTLAADAAASGTTVAYRCQMMGFAVR